MSLEPPRHLAAADANPLLQVYLLGLVDFEAALALQRRLVYEVAGRRASAAMILCEHPQLVTVGRQGGWRHLPCDPVELRARGWPVRWVNRGGGCLMHQPGQLAIYPVLALDHSGLSLPSYLERLRQVLIELLTEFNIPAEVRPGQQGLWVGGRLIADLGIAVRHWVTYFGAVLNVNPDLVASRPIRTSELQTSLERERRGRLPPSLVRERFLEHFAARFSFAQTALFFDHPSLKRKAPLNAVATSS
jgi:lipoyl(octanoyl) transferase